MIKIITESEELSDEEKLIIKRYTAGGYKHINAQADEYLSGIPSERAFSKTGSDLYDIIENNKTKFKILYRIEAVDGFKVDNDIVSSPFREGQIIKWGLRSTSISERFIAKAARGEDRNLPFVGYDWGSKIVFRLRDEYGLDISELSKYKYQQEVLVSGEFEVVNSGSIESIGGEDVIVVDLRSRQNRY